MSASVTLLCESGCALTSLTVTNVSHGRGSDGLSVNRSIELMVLAQDDDVTRHWQWMARTESAVSKGERCRADAVTDRSGRGVRHYRR